MDRRRFILTTVAALLAPKLPALQAPGVVNRGVGFVAEELDGLPYAAILAYLTKEFEAIYATKVVAESPDHQWLCLMSENVHRYQEFFKGELYRGLRV